MIFVFPCASGSLKGAALTQSCYFIASHFGQESATPTFPDKPVDIGNKILRQDNVGPFLLRNFNHTYSVTYWHHWSGLNVPASHIR